MSTDVAIKVGNWISDLCYSNQVKTTMLHFLGGEPLLNLPAVTTIIDTFNKNKPDFTKPAGRNGNEGLVLFTNGDYITNLETMKLLKDRRVIIKMNPTTESLPVIEKRISVIKNYFGGAGLAIVLDDFNMERLPDLVSMGVKHKIHTRINRLYGGGSIQGYVERYRQQMHKAFDILLTSDWVMWPNFILESSYVTWVGPKNPYPCGKSLLVIGPDCIVRSCNADPTTNMGNINSVTGKISKQQFKCHWTAKHLPECQGCEWITWCQGGCPYTRKLTYGHFNKRTPFCSAFKELWPRVFELKEKWKNV
jgi:radical SAM protein with 4Fe4S-binding SPASM domain